MRCWLVLGWRTTGVWLFLGSMFSWGVCLPGEIQTGTSYNFPPWPGLRDDGGWLGLRDGSFRPMSFSRNNTLHRVAGPRGFSIVDSLTAARCM